MNNTLPVLDWTINLLIVQALMGAFEAAVRIGTGGKAVHCLLCLAENAIGPTAFRNDDILTFFSGRTCEVNVCPPHQP